MTWPVHISYSTSEGRHGCFVFSGKVFTFNLELKEDEAVWFNKDSIGFYLAIPKMDYFINNLIPNITDFSDADQWSMLFTLTKMGTPQDELLPVLFSLRSSKSLATWYSINELLE